MLLDEDGLEEGWAGVDGHHSSEDVQRIFHRAENALPTTDSSGMGRGSRPARDHDEQAVPEFESSHVTLRKQIIEHFDFMWRNRRVVWPSRNLVPEETALI